MHQLMAYNYSTLYTHSIAHPHTAHRTPPVTQPYLAHTSPTWVYGVHLYTTGNHVSNVIASNNSGSGILLNTTIHVVLLLYNVYDYNTLMYIMVL